MVSQMNYTEHLKELIPRDTGVLMHRGTFTPLFMVALSTIAKLWKEHKCPSTDEWIGKLWFVYTTEYYEAMTKKEIWPFVATWMEVESVMLSEISHTEKDRYRVFTLMWILRNLTKDHGGGDEIKKKRLEREAAKT